MPTFDIPGPDGKTYPVTVPEGKTREDALEYFRRRHPSVENADPGWYETAKQAIREFRADPRAAAEATGLGAVHGVGAKLAEVPGQGDLPGMGWLREHLANEPLLSMFVPPDISAMREDLARQVGPSESTAAGRLGRGAGEFAAETVPSAMIPEVGLGQWAARYGTPLAHLATQAGLIGLLSRAMGHGAWWPYLGLAPVVGSATQRLAKPALRAGGYLAEKIGETEAARAIGKYFTGGDADSGKRPRGTITITPRGQAPADDRFSDDTYFPSR